MAAQFFNQKQGLPKTIEEASRRYLNNYEANYRGEAHDMLRLKKLAQDKIFKLRRKAPKFFEEKLPALINQAGSVLLSCNISKPDGLYKFHQTHKHLLNILDELTRSQPAGEVNFETERDRVEERDKLRKEQLSIRDELGKLGATEIDVDDIGDDECDTYSEIFARTERLQAKLKHISLMIAKMEGENIERDVEFELRIHERSSLKRLTQEQRDNLEQQIKGFLVEHSQKRVAMYVDKSIIDDMLKKLDLDLEMFTKRELDDLSKDALDAYRQFYRDLDHERRTEYHEALLSDKSLRPKEGIILDGPDDIPDEVKQQLDRTDMTYRRQIEDKIEEYAQKPCNEDALFKDSLDDVEDDASKDIDPNDGDVAELLEYMSTRGHIFNRIKEEPRDDYDNDAPSEDEIVVDQALVETMDDDIIEIIEIHRGPDQNRAASVMSESPVDDDADDNDISMQQNNDQLHDETERPFSQAREASPIMRDDSDDEIELLGVVEPVDKIAEVNID